MVHKNVFRDCVKHVVMQHCHIALWHDGLKHSRKVGMPFRTTSVRTTPHGEQHSSTPWFPVRYWLSVDCMWICSSRNVSLNCAWGTNQFPNPPLKMGITIKKIIMKACTTFWVTANFQRIGYPMNFPRCNNGNAMQSHRPCCTGTKGRIVAMDETWARSH